MSASARRSCATRCSRVSTAHRAYIEHTDAYGVMFYANHFRALADAVEELGDGFRRVRATDIVGCRYARAVRLGEAWVTTSEVMEARGDGTTVRQTMRAANDAAVTHLVADVTYARERDTGMTTSVVAPDWRARTGAATTRIRMFRGESSRGDDGCSHVDVLRFFERGRTDAIGGSDALAKLRDEHGVVVVVSRLEASFPERIVPRRENDGSIPTCEVRSFVEIKRRGLEIVFHQALYDSDGVTCLGRGSIACACLDGASMRPKSCPPALADAFAPFTLVPPETASSIPP